MDFLEARHYTPVTSRHIDILVIHDMEMAERPDTAEACARVFATTDREASAHYCIDADSVVQSVRDHDIAYAAPGSNSNGLHFEHAGYAAQRADDWKDPYSTAELDRSARLVASKSVEYGIPSAWLTVEDLQGGLRGITSHWNVSRAFHLSTHTDPGPNFPISYYIGLVRTHLPLHHTPPAETHRRVPKTVQKGDHGWPVPKAQRHLRVHGFSPGQVDGVFGMNTLRAVKRFQRHEGLRIDGIVGPGTWQRLLR